ncbi:MAG: DUF4012 domain-containing protein [Patescibacteria group bacterium]|nr:DUF4012 domain-containing protein [Patescibacteria group bacterium]
MQRKVAKKNISKKILDIFPPFKKKDLEDKNVKSHIRDINFIYNNFPRQEKVNNLFFKKTKKIFIIFLFLGLFLLVILGFFYIKNNLKINIPKIYVDNSYKNWYEETLLNQIEDNNSLINSNSVLDKFKFIFSLISQNILGSKDLITNINLLLFNLNYILNNWPNFILGKIDSSDIRQNFLNISNALNNIKDNLNEIKLKDLIFNNNDIFYIRDQINYLTNFLNYFVEFMDSPERRNFLFLFSNTSEMRPGGGFIGSYAHISILNWKIDQINILDINEPDKEFDSKIIPPWPLQNVLIGWKAADANWFLDFDKSASKVINFLENSNFYKKNNIKFDGAILITPKVIEDILTITGPITIDSNIVLNNDNFLIEIQKNIQQKRQNKIESPKQILDSFWNKALEKISNLDYQARNQILNYLIDWMKNKDLVFYFKDKNFQSFFENYNLTGKSTSLESNFFGDYLAVVDANPSSGKSDIFIKKIVNLKINILNNGILNNELEIKRINNVSSTFDWWYKLTNVDFLQIFTLPNVEIINVSGGKDKKIYPRINYKKNGFVFDNDLAYEKTIKTIDAFPQIKKYDFENKNIFSTWLETELGKTSFLKLEYSRNLFKIPSPGNKFIFILDHQIGDRGEYNIEIEAPIGFKFKENNSSVFNYSIKNSAKNLKLELTLIEDI